MRLGGKMAKPLQTPTANPLKATEGVEIVNTAECEAIIQEKVGICHLLSQMAKIPGEGVVRDYF